MAFAVARHADNAAENNVPPSRDQVLAHYRQLRISKRHHHEILKFLWATRSLHQAHRLGLAKGKTLILNDMDEMTMSDLVIHTASAGRSRALDRYSRSARFCGRLR